MCPGVWPVGWLKCLAHPLGGTLCRGHAQYPAFAPGPSEATDADAEAPILWPPGAKSQPIGKDPDGRKD